MSTKEILIQVRSLLDSPANWTQGVFARNNRGLECPPNSEEAVCWCLIGSLHKVSPGNTDKDIRRRITALEALRVSIGPKDPAYVASFNDTVQHSDVINLLDSTIENLSEE